MVESFNGPFEPVDPVPPTRWQRFREHLRGRSEIVILNLLALLAVLLVYLFFFSSNEKRVVLNDGDFYCSQQTAQKRFRFDRVETCDQYTRRAGNDRWSK